MIAVEINFKNKDEVLKNLDNLGKNLRAALKEALGSSAEQVKKEAVPLVRTRTGKTRRGVKSSIDKSKLTGHVGSDWFVSRFLEHGTKKMRAYPFLRPALDKSREDIRKFFLDAIDRAIIKTSRT